MSEKPIIFSGPMVRAIREGRKNQTRRVVKVCCERAAHPMMGTWGVDFTACECGAVKMPYAPGDALWVREAWAECTECGGVVFRANGEHAKCENCEDGYGGRWRPSIHMPRWAARTFLTVTRVRIERLQDISEADAIAEGVDLNNLPDEDDEYCGFVGTRRQRVRGAFMDLWTSIHGEGAWDANPWVWVYDFEPRA